MDKDAEEYAQALIAAGMPAEQAYEIAAKTPRRSPATRANKARKSKPEAPAATVRPHGTRLEIDYRQPDAVPSWVQEVINTHLAIEAEDAKKAGALGFMARALVLATLPYRDQKHPDGSPKESFTRVNGDFRLRIVAGYEGGIPYGIYPRLLMSWVTTEAVRKQSPVIELGDSLRVFLRDVLDLRSRGGGARGTSTRVTEQMKRLFGSMVSANYEGAANGKQRPFSLKNVLIADNLDLADSIDALNLDNDAQDALWQPQARHEAGAWQSKVKLNMKFFEECVTNPVPIDLRAYKALRGSALAMDIYTWLTYRMSYVDGKTRPIRWEALLMQFGSGIGAAASNEEAMRRAVHNFKREFLKALQLVQIVYPGARVKPIENGLVLLASPPHVSPQAAQQSLF